MTHRLDAVERTALLTAALRAARPGGRTGSTTTRTPPRSPATSGPELLAEVRAVTFPPDRPTRTLPSTPDYNAIRTRFFDDCLARRGPRSRA